MSSRQKLLFWQTGDFREAYQRLRSGGPETYRDQRRSVDFAASLTNRFDVVIVATRAEPYKETLAEDLRAVGLSAAMSFDKKGVSQLLDDLSPDLIICRTPTPGALAWAKRRQVPTLPTFADIFARGGPRTMWRNLQLKRLLTGPHIPCIANHSLNASQSLVSALGLPAQKVAPWDWARVPTTARQPGQTPPLIFFAGALSEPKGVGDCLGALKRLADRGVACRFEFAGPGDTDDWRSRASALGVGAHADFPGVIPHADVRARMAAADVVVVPSRHDYPEGLPNVIYEALAAGAPLVLSDHPAFGGRVKDEAACLTFPAGDADALANQIGRILSDPPLAAALTRAAPAAHDALYIGLEWTALVELFLNDPTNRTGWVAEHSFERLAPNDPAQPAR